MGGCPNYGPFLGPYYGTAPNIQGTQKGTIILTTTHVWILRATSTNNKALQAHKEPQELKSDFNMKLKPLNREVVTLSPQPYTRTLNPKTLNPKVLYLQNRKPSQSNRESLCKSLRTVSRSLACRLAAWGFLIAPTPTK